MSTTASHEEVAAQITSAWVQAVAQVAVANQGTAVAKTMYEQLTQDSVVGFYKQIHKQIKDSFNGR